MAFLQPDEHNTFTAIAALLDDFNWGATVIGAGSLLLLVMWDKVKRLKTSRVPGPLVVVVFGIAMAEWLRQWGGDWPIEASHLVQVPVMNSLKGAFSLLTLPDASAWTSPATNVSASRAAAMASLFPIERQLAALTATSSESLARTATDQRSAKM